MSETDVLRELVGYVLQPWVAGVGLKQQSILLSGLRAPDASTKAVKKCVRWLRAQCQIDADPAKQSYMETQTMTEELQETALGELEYLSVHYVHHLADSFAVLAYHNPDAEVRRLAYRLHLRIAEGLFHFVPETRAQFLDRHRDKREQSAAERTLAAAPEKAAPVEGPQKDYKCCRCGFEGTLNECMDHSVDRECTPAATGQARTCELCGCVNGACTHPFCSGCQGKAGQAERPVDCSQHLPYQNLRDDYDKLQAELGRVRQQFNTMRDAEHALSDAYVRLRKMIPGAFDTPYAPTGEQIWKHTEACLERLRTAAPAAPQVPLSAVKIMLDTKSWGAAYGAVCEDYPELAKLFQCGPQGRDAVLEDLHIDSGALGAFLYRQELDATASEMKYTNVASAASLLAKCRAIAKRLCTIKGTPAPQGDDNAK
jgi:hypothetical protein